MLSLVTLLLLAGAVGTAYQAVLPSNTVEVYFVADRQVIDRYIVEQKDSDESVKESNALKSFNDDVDYLLTEANKLFASLQQKGINIRIAKKKLDILSTNLFPDNSNAGSSLAAFDAWLLEQSSYQTITYDAAIFWTGFNLHQDGNNGIAGLAHVGKVCSSINSTGIVEFDLTYHTALVTAHEIGHILGASHDSQATGFMMVPESGPLQANRWSFSSCSSETFQAIIGNLNQNCLASTDGSSDIPEVDVTDAMANPDTVCKRDKNDQESYMCKAWSLYDGTAPSGDALCKNIWCRKPGTTKCNRAFTSDGMICGQNKRCEQGFCVDHPDSESSTADESCLFGDEHYVRFNKNNNGQITYHEGACPSVIDVIGAESCYSSAVNTHCCGTCKSLQTGISGCEYGDRNPVCNGYRKKRGANLNATAHVDIKQGQYGEVKEEAKLKEFEMEREKKDALPDVMD